MKRRSLISLPVHFALWPAAAIARQDSPVLLHVISRDTDSVLPTYRHQGQFFVPGTPGDRYALRLRNTHSGNVLAVVSVDGVNVVSGQTANWSQRGYVLAPNSFIDIVGWRKSDSEVAQFYFSSLRDSYAGRTGRPSNVGVIGVAVFLEAGRDSFFFPKRDSSRVEAPASESSSSNDSSQGPTDPSANAQRSDASTAKSSASPAPPAPGAQLGTGHGSRELSPATTTQFQRSTTSPVQVIELRYDSRDNLVALGVIPPPYHSPRPFPTNPPTYVPDPPRR